MSVVEVDGTAGDGDRDTAVVNVDGIAKWSRWIELVRGAGRRDAIAADPAHGRVY